MPELLSLDLLPTELVENISSFLPLSALLALRLTSPALSYKSSHYFATTFFRELRVSLSVTGLRDLCGLARHRQLSRYVRFLVVRIASCRATLRGPGELSVCQSNGGAEAEECVEFLARALAELGNLEGVCIVDETARLIHRSTCLSGSLSPAAFLPKSKAHSGSFKEFRTSHAHGIAMVLAAVKESGIPLRHLGLEIPVPVYGHQLGRGPAARLWKGMYGSEKIFVYCFAGLRSLSLRVRGHEHWMASLSDTPVCFCRLVMLAPELEALALRWDAKTNSAPLIRELALHLRLPKLKALALEGFQVEEDDLTQLLSKHAGSMEKLSLLGVRMVSGTWSHFVGRELLKAAPRLEELTVRDATEDGFSGFGWPTLQGGERITDGLQAMSEALVELEWETDDEG